MSKVNAITQVAKSLANTAPVTNALSLSDDSKKLVVSFAKASKTETETKKFLADSLFADGFRSYHIVGATDEDKSLVALRNQIIQLIVSADPEDAKVYNAETKTLSLALQGAQHSLKTKIIPDLIKNIKGALARREVSASKTEGKKKASTKEQMVLKSVKQAIKYLKECKNGYAGFTTDLETLNNLAVLKQVK